MKRASSDDQNDDPSAPAVDVAAAAGLDVTAVQPSAASAGGGLRAPAVPGG